MSNPRKMQHEGGERGQRESREDGMCDVGREVPDARNSVSLVLMTPLGVDEESVDERGDLLPPLAG